MDAEDANSVLYSVSNSSPVLLHALVLSDNLLHVHTEIGYCSVVYLITVPYLEHYIAELDCTMCFIDHTNSIFRHALSSACLNIDLL